ncbi:hypothetical protein [Mesorhizobium sp.]|uniref:hypothetical protein n=1 Tax=Mesorhizobium sp. TaxID=1871066 RepID=UPI0025C53D04|nr:hypothetical protein [Mesorhizobium sp.]
MATVFDSREIAVLPVRLLMVMLHHLRILLVSRQKGGSQNAQQEKQGDTSPE